MLTEIIAKRTYTQKYFRRDDGKFVLHAHAGHIHYKDDQGFFRDSDYSLEDMSSYWRMEKANYHIYIAKDFGASQLIRFENHYEGTNHTIYFEPHSLWWVDRTNPSNRTLFRNAQSVQGMIDAQPNKITWKNAFGSDIDFEVQLRRSGFQKNIIIQNAAALGTPPSANHDLVVICQYVISGLTLRSNDGSSDWDESSRYESEEGFTIREVIVASRTFIRPSFAEDAEGNRRKLKVFWEKRQGKLWQAKILPLAQLQAATYPIRADTTTDYWVGAGDGEIWNNNQATWALAHDATSGIGADYTGSDGASRSCKTTGSLFSIWRSFGPIDTSGLPDVCTILSAAFYFWVLVKALNEDDGYGYVSLIQTSQASPTQLITDDFDQVGIIKGANDIDISAITTGIYNYFTLNATGLNWINKTGYTLLGMRTGHDVMNVAPDVLNNTGNLVGWYFSKQAGTANDPYLEVVYTVDYVLTVDPGSYALTGQAVSPLHNKLLGIGAGAYSLSGQIAGLLFNRVVSTDTGSYLLAGQDVGILYGRLISAGTASYLITGQGAGLLHNKIISIGAGSYILIGQDVTLTYISGYVLAAEAGSYTLAGQIANLLKAHKLSLDAGAYLLTGQDAATLLSRLISAEGGSYGISGQVADLLRAGKISIGPGAYLLIGTDAGLTYSGIQVFPIIFDVLARQRIFDSEDRDRISDVESRDRIFDVKRRDN